MSEPRTLIIEPQNMTRDKFFERVQGLSDDYQSRLHPVVKKRLEGDVFFDVHAHCFNVDQVPSNFLQKRIQIPYKLLRNVVVRGLTKAFSFIRPVSMLSKIVYRRPTMIARTLVNCYHDVFKNNQERDRHVVVVMLSMNMDHGIQGDKHKNFRHQLASLGKVGNHFIDHRKGRKANGSILPYVAIDPNREDAYEVFLNAFETNSFGKNIYGYPFFGVKLYPSLGYLPSHPILMDIFKVCSEKNIPVLTHCGGISTRTDALKVQIKGLDQQGNPIDTYHSFDLAQKGDDYEPYFLMPDLWRPVLDQYPNLRLNIAHLGSNKQWKEFLTFTNPDDPKIKHNFVYQTLQIIQEYKEVYADISYSLAEDNNLHKIKALMDAQDQIANHPNPTYQIIDKLMFGSDYYLMFMEQHINGAMNDFYDVFKQNDSNNLIQKLTNDNPRKHLLP